MMVTHQKMIVFASSIGFTTPWNIVERYSSKNRFKKVQIPKIPHWHKEGLQTPNIDKSIEKSKTLRKVSRGFYRARLPEGF